ncbi:Voltage-gated hydrogen channel 1 [Bulinus truncatus]|nr:Voltage-gated hydrogen channel 1 [Bulinus truncatus]
MTSQITNLVSEVDGRSSKNAIVQTSMDLNYLDRVKMLDILMSSPEAHAGVRSFRMKIFLILNSSKFMMAIIVLVILDICLILTELFLELAFLKKGMKLPEELEMLFLGLSLSILIIFVFEIILRIYAMGLSFFKHFLELMDASVIIVSLVIDLYTLMRNHNVIMAADLIILFRLWRVTRLFTGFISSLKMQNAIKACEEEHKYREMEHKIAQCLQNCQQQQERINYLTGLLKIANIHFDEQE